MKSLATEPYLEQLRRWPTSGRHILAHYDDQSIIVYQAYRPSIGEYAIEHGTFGGPDYSYERMSWIKPNFLWMMYRSGWGTKQGQEVVLGLRIHRSFFEEILLAAVPASYSNDAYATRKDWQAAVTKSDVRLQWDPDHDPYGNKHERRAIQLGLRGEFLVALGSKQIIEVIDMRGFVAEQHENMRQFRTHLLQTPVEHVYTPSDPAAATRVGLSSHP